MAVILVYFNPAMSVRIIQNLLTVKFWLDRVKIPYFIGELAHNDNPFIFTEAPNICQFRSESLMFYKENLIKAVESNIPPQFTKLFFMDADILYKDPMWYDIVSLSLDSVEVCQPFQTAHMLNIDFTVRKSMSSIFNVDSTSVTLTANHPGYCWAMRREWYHRINPSDLAVIGGGDIVFYKYVTKNLSFQATESEATLYKFMEPEIAALPGSTSSCSCPLTIVHLNHGTQKNRQFHNRSQSVLGILHEINPSFTLLDILERRSDGILEWKPAYRTQINKYYAKFFVNRRDDSPASGEIATHRLKFYPCSYTPPHRKDMAVILVFFNYVNCFRSIQNIIMTKHWLETANIPTMVAELAFDDDQFLIPHSSNVFHIRSNSFMFYKENLISYVSKRIPTTFTKICLLDADIFFDRSDWYSLVSQTLDHKNAIQPFKVANWLDIDYTVFRSRHNAIDTGAAPINWNLHHPGFAYAFDLDFFKKLDIKSFFTNGGDTILNDILCSRDGSDIHGTTRFYLENGIVRRDPIIDSACLGSCNLNIYHLNHGARKNRRHYNIALIHRCMKIACGVDSSRTFIQLRPDGILEWAPTYRKVYNRIMLNYVYDRKEDEGDAEDTEDFHIYSK